MGEFILVFAIGFILQYVIKIYLDKVGYGYSSKLAYISSAIEGTTLILLLNKYGLEYKFFIYSLVFTVLIAITFVDLTRKIIPNRLNLAIFIIGLINAVIEPQSFLSNLGTGIFAGALFLVMALVSGGAMGGGDIKLIAPLGFVLGFYSTIYVILMTFIVGAVVSIALLIANKANLASEIALAPYITTAVYILVFANDFILILLI